MKNGMTLKQHADQARSIRQMAQDMRDMQREVLPAYPKKSRMNSRIKTAERALSRLRSELEEALYRDHPDTAWKVGFPHYSDEALGRLMEESTCDAEY